MKEWENRVLDFVKDMESAGAQARKVPLSPEVVSAISVISVYESSKKIELYSKALISLTLALVILTIVLAIGEFHP